MPNLDTEIVRLADTARSVAESLRLRAAAIENVADRILESKNPSDATHVVELVQATVANAKLDLLMAQVIRATRAEQK